MIKYDLKTCINKDEAYVIYTSSGLDWQRPKDDMHHPPSAFEFTFSAYVQMRCISSDLLFRCVFIICVFQYKRTSPLLSLIAS